MKHKMLIIILLLLASMVPFNKSNASDYLIEVGNGVYHTIVRENTKISDIVKTLGEAKVVTDSPYGGHAYSFYTDDNYSNYLYIETDEEENIISYGSVDPSYKTPTYSYNSDYNYKENGVLHGCLYNVDGKIKGGVYYNKQKIINYNETVEKYKTNYLNNELKYSYSLSKHGVIMFNAISKNLGYNNGLVFEDEAFYENYQLKELGSSYKKMLEISDKSQEYRGIKLREKVDFTNAVYYILNPLIYGSLASYANGVDFVEKNIAIFDYDKDTKIITTGAIRKGALSKIDTICYTEEETRKLEEGRKLYQSAISKLYQEDAIYKIVPQTKIPGSLVAGELVDSKKQGILDYINAIRVAGGLPKYVYDAQAYSYSQHIATLISYRKTELGLDITHIPAKPNGVTDEYYQASLSVNDGYAENLGYAQNETSTSIMMHHINMFLDDEAERPQNFSHRTKMLDTEFTNFGYGISNVTFANEFKGYKASDIKLQAWPTEGITFMESLVRRNFKWTSQFVKQYKVQDNTTVSVKCLNTNQEWNWIEEEGTTSSNRYFTRYTKSVSSINNKVVFYDSTLIPEAGFVYEITVKNLLDETNNKTTNYTYRTVFENADTNASLKKITSLNLEVSSKLTKVNEDTYKANIGDIAKINAKIGTTGTNEIYKLKWTSSDSSKIEVTQNGQITIKNLIETPVTISVMDEYSGLRKSIKIITGLEGVSFYLDKREYQLNSVGETVKLNALLSTGILTNATWTSSNSDIASVDNNGLVTARNGGFVKIKATSSFGTSECYLYVSVARPLPDGSKAYPGDPNRDGVFNSIDVSVLSDWYSSVLTRDQIAIGDINCDGVVNSNDAAILSDWYNSAPLFQPGTYSHITNISLDKTNLTLDKGNRVVINATIAPQDTTDSPYIYWKTSNENVVKVDQNGLVTAIGGGTATITARANNGKGVSATSTITVLGPALEVPITSVSLNKTTLTMNVGNMETLKATINPYNTTMDKTVSFISSDKSIVEVDSNGSIFAKKAGTVEIKAITMNNKIAKCIVTVLEDKKSINNIVLPSGVKYAWTGIAIKPKVIVKDGENILIYGTDYTINYQNNINVGNGTLTVVGKGKYSGTISKSFQIIKSDLSYQVSVQKIGWLDKVPNGEIAGTTGSGLRMETLKVNLEKQPYSGNVEYRTHIQKKGWETTWKKNGEASGSIGEGLRLEAVQIRLTGDMAKNYDIYYRIHSQRFGWLDWAKNGEKAGTAGFGFRVEAIQIKLVKKGGSAPEKTTRPYVSFDNTSISYQTQVQKQGWLNPVTNGVTSGTTGSGLRMEGLKIKLANQGFTGNIEYRTHIQKTGWESTWKKNGELSGTQGKGLRLEALQLRLTGNMAKEYDIYYRVHAQKFGWLGWAKNGESAGTAGFGYRLEAIQIVLVRKGLPAPGSTENHYYQN